MVNKSQDKQQAWDYQDSDKPKSWEAFQIYRDMGRSRTLLRVGIELGKSEGLMERWSFTHDWVERVNWYDLYLDAKAHKRNEVDYLKRRVRAKNNRLDFADVEINLAGRILKAVQDNPKATPEQISTAIQIASKATDESRKEYDDLPTNRTEIIDRRLLQETIAAIKKMGQEPADVFNELIRIAQEQNQ